MVTNSITFNGVNSLVNGLYVSGSRTFNSAEKDYTKVSVPGRSGDLLIFNNRYKNVEVVYDAIVIDDYANRTEDIRAWLLSANGYCRLEDTYHPNEFRMASFSGPIDFDTVMLEAGATELTFDCKPQRWLKIGEVPIIIEATEQTITNPTLFQAKPLIRVYGAGVIGIGNSSITVLTAGANYIDIDCDTQNCYEGTNNKNYQVEISKWPILQPGPNTISFEGGITKVQIIPRWWTL